MITIGDSPPRKPFSNDDFAPSNSKIFSADAEAPPSAAHSPPHPPGLCSAFLVAGVSASAEKILEFEGAKSSFQKGLCDVEDYVALNLVLNLQMLNKIFFYNLIIYN